MEDYDHVNGALDGGNQGQTMADSARKLIEQSHVTKAVASLLHLFNSVTDLADLRSKVATELKTFRSKGFMEKAVFPPPLLKAVGLALAMRKPV